jgi:hypothetical protein
LLRYGGLAGEIPWVEFAVPLRAAGARVLASEGVEARLARYLLADSPTAAATAMTLLEYYEPCSLDIAVALIAGQGVVAVQVFDAVADAWERYRHVRHLAWD